MLILAGYLVQLVIILPCSYSLPSLLELSEYFTFTRFD